MRLLTCTTACALLACGPGHVQLQAPSKDAPAAARLKAFESLAPAQQNTVTNVAVSDGNVSVSQYTYLILRDGRRVYAGEDLLPVVPGGSPPAISGEKSRSARSSARSWYLGSIGVGLAGLGLTFYGLDNYEPEPFDSSDPGTGSDDTLLYAGLGLVTVAAIGWYVGRYFSGVAQSETRAAFATYEPALLERLSLCFGGLQIVDCEAPGKVRAEPVAAPPRAAPTAGSEGGPCYGNSTCNDGLTCASNLCVRLPAQPTP